MVNSATFPNGLTVNDGLYDEVTNPQGLANGGSRVNLVPAMSAQVDTYNRTVTAQTAAAASAASAAAYALGPTTSATSLTISVGTKTATLASPLSIANGAMLRFVDSANTANYFTMKVTSGGGTTSVTGDVATIGGSGTKSSWLVQVTGADGGPGPAFWITTAVKTSANSPYAAADGEMVLVDTTSGAVTVTYPSGGARLRVVDVGGALASNAITIARNGYTIDGVAANMVLTVPGAWVEIVRNNTNLATSWRATAPQIGDVLITARTPPAQWLACGAAYSQSTYASLYALIGIRGNEPTAWTARTSGIANQLNAVAYGAGVFVAVSNNGDLLSSADAVTWTARTSQFSSTPIYGVAWSGSLFVAVGGSGKISTSSDGITWTARTSGVATDLTAVAYGGSIWVAVGASGVILSSTDGTTWTSRTSGFGAVVIGSIAWSGTRFVAGGASGAISYSTNGTSWTYSASATGLSGTIYALVWNGSKFLAGTASGLLAQSSDGLTWAALVITGTAMSTFYSAAAGAGYTILGGNTAASVATLTYTTDLANWSDKNLGWTSAVVQGLAYGNGIFVAVGAGGKIATATVYAYNTSTQFWVPEVSVRPGLTAYVRGVA